jgi:transcriptional regulator with PAS, ATPase and Fis domain
MTWAIGNGTSPNSRKLLEEILPQNTSFHDFEVEHDFETIGTKIMHLNARRIYNRRQPDQLILLAIEDVTEREYYKRHLVTRRSSVERTNWSKSMKLKLKDQLEAERAYLQEEIKLEFNHENIIGRSNEINYVFYKVEQIAGTDTNVLVLGETGTGKELVARAVHGLSGAKGSGPGKNELCRAAFESH